MTKYFPDVSSLFAFYAVSEKCLSHIESRARAGRRNVEKRLMHGNPASAPNFDNKFNTIRLVLFFVESGLMKNMDVWRD